MKKKSFLLLVPLFAAIGSFAQRESDQFPYNKKKLDSLFKSFPESDPSFDLRLPKGYSLPENMYSEKQAGNFEITNPGVVIISQTEIGTIYNMPLDNMAVLVPGMRQVERMPGSSRYYKPAPPGNMPNPLHPGVLPEKK